MFVDYLLNTQPIILIKDQLGIEKTAKEVVSIWLKDGKGSKALLKPVDSLNELSDYLFAPISKLARVKSPPELFEFVQRCKRNESIRYVFLWATEKNISLNFLVPYLEYQSHVVVTLEDERHISILVKKLGQKKYYQYQLQEHNFSAKELKKMDRSKVTSAVKSTSIDPASLGTFKIGNLNEEEQQAKEALTLPFEFFKTTAVGGRVLYHPDAQDDLDEEDPDDDLLV